MEEDCSIIEVNEVNERNERPVSVFFVEKSLWKNYCSSRSCCRSPLPMEGPSSWKSWIDGVLGSSTEVERRATSVWRIKSRKDLSC